MGKKKLAFNFSSVLKTVEEALEKNVWILVQL